MAAMTVSCAAWTQQIAAIHVEAGIRTLGLKKEFYRNIDKYSFDEYKKLINAEKIDSVSDIFADEVDALADIKFQ